MSAVTYRPDIDGLRAIAVLSVILFHAGVPFMGGGFVGVDVFFVISGYLITSLILKDLDSNSFTLARFWERRARRILPALCIMIAASLIAGWFLFLPEDFAMLGREVAAQAVFGSNILFYKEAGYFDQDSFLKPLLHTWSLAVEEQFYIFFPLAAVFVWNKYREKIFRLLVAATVASFVLCLIIMRANDNLAFYMLPFRGWELLCGAVLAYRRPALAEKFRPIMAMGGLTAILVPVFLYNKDTIFPGIGALPPTLGAVAIIWAGSGGGTSFVHRILTWRPVVFVGLISYSLYLWHWPIIVYAKYFPLLEYDFSTAAVCVGSSFIVAILSWRYIEMPFRRFEICALRKSLFRLSFATLMVLLLTGTTLIFSKGLPDRLDPAVARYASGISDDNPHRTECDKTPVSYIKNDKVCQIDAANGKPSFILWGDSQADAVAPVFYTLSEKYQRNGYVATHHGCPPILDYHLNDWDQGSDCVEFNYAVMDFIERHKIKNVFVVASWMSWINYGTQGMVKTGDHTPTTRVTETAMDKTFERLKRQGVKVYFLIDAPTQSFDVPRILAKQTLAGAEHNKGDTRQGYLNYRAKFFDAYAKTARDLILIDPLARMCPNEVCSYEYDGYSLYYNAGHLSTHGANYLAPLFEPYFKKGF